MTSTTKPAAPLPTTSDLLERIRADWAQVRPDLDPQPMLTVLLLDRLHSALARRVEQTYLESDINASNWDLLLTLLRSAPPEGPDAQRTQPAQRHLWGLDHQPGGAAARQETGGAGRQPA